MIRFGDDEFPDRLRRFDEHLGRLLRRDFRPDRHAIVGRQRLQHVGDVRGVHRSQPLAKLGDVLAVLQLLEEVSLGTLLLVRHRFEHAMTIEQPDDFAEALGEPGF